MASKNQNSAVDSEGFWKTLLKLHNVALWGSGLFLLVLVALIHESSGGGGLLDVIVRSADTVAIELGFALLIAAFLSAGIEKQTRQRFHAEVDSRITDIQKDVFRSTYRRDLPDQFFSEIEKLILGSDFSHSNYRIEYAFSWSQTKADSSLPRLMDATINYIFSVRNLTAFASEHEIRVQVQELENVVDEYNAKVISVILRGHGKHGTLEPDQVNEINRKSECSDGIREFRIQTGTVPPSESIEVEIVAQSIVLGSGVAFSRCSAPSHGLTVAATFPADIDLLSVGTDTAHRTRCKNIPIDYAKNHYSWSIEGAVLPGQGISFWWIEDLGQTLKKR